MDREKILMATKFIVRAMEEFEPNEQLLILSLAMDATVKGINAVYKFVEKSPEEMLSMLEEILGDPESEVGR